MPEDKPEPNYRGYEITVDDSGKNFYVKGLGSFKSEQEAKDKIDKYLKAFEQGYLPPPQGSKPDTL